MKVLLLVRPAEGGIKRHIEMLSEYLPTKGISVGIAASEKLLTDISGSIPSDVKYYYVPMPSSYSLKEVWKAAQCLKAHWSEFDIVHGHGLLSAWTLLFAKGFSKKPTVVTLHNVCPPLSRIKRIMLALTLSRASKVIAVSQAVAMSAKAPRGLKSQVVPNGVVAPPELQRNSPNGTFTIGAIGRLSPEKGFDILIAAMSQLPGHLLKIAGDGPERKALEDQAIQTGVQNQIEFLGRVENTNGFYESIDCLVVPSRSEGQGIVALEAMAHSVPVVASNVGGLPEVVIEGATGLTVTAEDTAEMAEAIKQLTGDEDLRQRLGEAGRKCVLEQFSVASMISGTVQVYHDLLSGK